jgi:hypothetical protein
MNKSHKMLMALLILASLLGVFYFFHSSSNVSIRISSPEKNIGQVTLSGGKWNVSLKNVERNNEQLTIQSNRDIAWRDVDCVINELFDIGLRFNEVFILWDEYQVDMYFPTSDELKGLPYSLWNFTDIPLLKSVTMPLVPSYENQSSLITIASLSSSGRITSGFSDQPVNTPVKVKNNYVILYVDRGKKISEVATAISELKSVGYLKVLVVAGSSPGRWPPFVIQRSMAELPIEIE